MNQPDGQDQIASLADYPCQIAHRVTGVGNSEGPVHLHHGGLAFVSMSHGRVYRVDEPGGQPTVVADVGGSPNGLVESSDGSLYVAQNGGTPLRAADDRITAGVQVVRHNGYFELLFSDGMVAPNDLAFGPDGRLYVTDPTRGRRDDGRIWRCDVETGELVLLAEVDWYPNGVGFSSDDAYIFVADTGGRRILRFALEDRLGDPMEVVRLHEETEPDGFAFDQDDNLVVACTHPAGGQGHLQIWNRAGELVQVLSLTTGPFLTNVALSPTGELAFTDASGGAVCWIDDWPTAGLRLHPFRNASPGDER
jgi:gluconolactonase